MPETRKTNPPKSKQAVSTPSTPGRTPADTPKTNRRQAAEAKPADDHQGVNLINYEDENDNDLKIRKLYDQQEAMSKLLENLIRKADIQDKRLTEKDAEIMRLSHKVAELDRNAELVKLKLCDLENDTKMHNLRIDGKEEDRNEDLKLFVLELANKVGTTVTNGEIESIFRIGKAPNGTRPRTIMVRFTTREARNRLYFSRTKLNERNQGRDNATTSKIWINDDITPNTARQREELRSIAELCKSKGEADVKVHTDGIILRNKKYKMDDLTSLPNDLTLADAKTITRGDQVYFQSQHSVLSNLYPCHLVIDGFHYSSAEQALQCSKASYAKATAASNRIWEERDPYEQKKLGEQIAQSTGWDNQKVEKLERILEAKFSQNPELKKALLITGNRKLNEATRDSFWGIGCALNTQQAKNHTWRGANKTGRALEKLREKLTQI